MTEKGGKANLVASHPGNASAVKSGVFSRTGAPLAPRVREIADEIMALPHTVEIDEIGAVEIGKLVATIEAIDADLAERGLTRRNGDPRALIDLRLRASRRLAEMLDRYGATPYSRAKWAKTLATGGLADELARRRRQRQEDPSA